MKDQPIQFSQVAALIKRWRDHYPEDIFPPDGDTAECKAAKLARHVCDGIEQDLRQLLVS